ncbi:MAG: hypothetical protein KDA70_12740 [Planctomycetaceae bacterium]|uniref:hypothetical protein n=1 Tax=Gimesia sp. TaxID=2024833 RepID=UPI001D927BE2|nr:hypothetical protein [Planctomycetaceae bacterium]MCA9019366.1 hypothetical protein [Planctomycetaceae bacterium]
MRAAFVCIVMIQPLIVCSGCQCFRASNVYYNLIDDISDTQLYADRFYRPTWDLTRIGKPDWCQSRFNRWWCKCCDDCQMQHYISDTPVTEYSSQQSYDGEAVDDLVPLPEPSIFVPPDPFPNETGLESELKEPGPALAPPVNAPPN